MWPFKQKQKKQKDKFVEGKDYRILPDIDRAKQKDPYPWNLQFRNRLIKVNHVGINDGSPVVNINIDYLSGPPFDEYESKLFGDLLIDIIRKGLEYVEKNPEPKQ